MISAAGVSACSTAGMARGRKLAASTSLLRNCRLRSPALPQTLAASLSVRHLLAARQHKLLVSSWPQLGHTVGPTGCTPGSIGTPGRSVLVAVRRQASHLQGAVEVLQTLLVHRRRAAAALSSLSFSRFWICRTTHQAMKWFGPVPISESTVLESTLHFLETGSGTPASIFELFFFFATNGIHRRSAYVMQARSTRASSTPMGNNKTKPKALKQRKHNQHKQYKTCKQCRCDQGGHSARWPRSAAARLGAPQ